MRPHFSLGLAVCATLLSAQIKIPKVPKLPGAQSSKGAPPASPLGGGGKVKAELDQAERALDACDRHLKKDGVEACAQDHAKFDDSIADAQRAIQGGTLGGAAEFVTRIQQLKARRDEQLQAMKGSTEKTAALNATFSGDQAEKDKNAIEALKSFYKTFHGIVGSSAPTDALLDASTQWAPVQAEVKRLLAAYPLVKSRQQMDPSTHEMITAVRGLDDDHRRALGEVDRFMGLVPQHLKMDLAGGQERIGKVDRDGLTDPGYSVEKYVDNIDRRFRLYALAGAGHPKSDANLEPSIRPEQKRLRDWFDKFMEKTIASNTLPADDYSGPDAAGLKAAAQAIWTKNYPDIKFVRAALRGTWTRNLGWKWDDARSAWYKFDSAFLAGYILVDTGHPKYLYLRSVSHTKDYLNGGKLETKVGIWDKSEKPHPAITYLREKVK